VKTSDFDYVLPPERIAAFPAPRRDSSRLLVLGRQAGEPAHLQFEQIHACAPPGALLVLNDTRVIPARIRGRKATGGSFELLLLRRIAHADDPAGPERWEALSRNLAGAAIGTQLGLEDGWIAELQERGEAGVVRISLRSPPGSDHTAESVMSFLDRNGELPLPPYIEAARRRQDDEHGRSLTGDGDDDDDDANTDAHGAATAMDRERYQTVYATQPGAVAAPTAGLHFTEDALARLRTAGHEVTFLTLHVGPGTFRPVNVEDPDRHEMEAETYSIPASTAAAVEAARRSRRPVLAVGTTVVRALESAARTGDGVVRPGTASSRLFLRPGSDFHVVTDLLTNFHLPRSTLLMLVSAFAGRERVLRAYAEAITAGYRFYTYGDAMLIRGTS
jgi:S-adenosylmethionine:tRNA ribosyltransferase-isomerase